MIKRIAAILFFIALSAYGSLAGAQQATREALVLTAQGPLTPAMAEYLARGLSAAEQRSAEIVILQLDTPGGSIDLMQQIVQTIRTSTVPVVVYVAPQGAIAGSAGTVITLAGHAAAMAPETAIGAASPVGAEGEDIGETLEVKVKETMRALVRTLSEGRPPDAIALAEDTIENAIAVSASEAHAIGMVDYIAADVPDLLRQLDGQTVETTAGTTTLDTAFLSVVAFNPTFIEQLLATLTNPNIVFILLTLGLQAVLIELGSPGGWVAGFVGVVALALAGYGLGILPVNLFGLIFVITAFVLFFLEIKAPVHGALSLAGIAVFIVGALVLFNSGGTPEFFQVSVPLVVATSLITASTFIAILTFAIRSQLTPIQIGQESLIGRSGVVRGTLAPNKSGSVQMGGELWTAELVEGEKGVKEGERVEVVAVEGVRLKVRKAG
jgi:membrane-bound serine protease (ClpP class)